MRAGSISQASFSSIEYSSHWYWCARTIDLDIILYGVQVVASKQLIIPHPEMMNRPFVLIPLSELESDLKVPVLGPLQALIDLIDTSDLVKL